MPVQEINGQSSVHHRPHLASPRAAAGTSLSSPPLPDDAAAQAPSLPPSLLLLLLLSLSLSLLSTFIILRAGR